VLGISKTCPISFMSTCFPMSVLAAVFWTMSSAYTLIQIYPESLPFDIWLVHWWPLVT
jgi:hypothetical protein